MIIKSVLLAGAGAIGLLVADSIYKTDPSCISILAAGERLKRYRANGLRINGRAVDFRITEEAKADLIIVACKFHHLDQIMEDMAPSVGKDTIILSLLNGISSEEIIGARFGRERLPLAMIIGTDASHQGEETRFSSRGVIHFGDSGGRNGEREQSIAEFFTRTGVPFVLEADMKKTLWYKFMMNAGVNPTTAILRLPYSAVKNTGGPGEIPEARQLMEAAMTEVIAVANAEGIGLAAADIEKQYTTLNSLNPSGYTSMCQDVMAKRKTEAEMFSLTVAELGKKHGIPVPVNEMFYLLLRAIEKSY